MSNTKFNYRFWIYLVFTILCVGAFLIPFLLILSISLTDESAIQSSGYSLWPVQFSVKAYQYVFANPWDIVNAYIVTGFSSIAGTILSVLIMAMCAYALSRPGFKARNGVSYFIFFTMIFSGGMIPLYIVNTRGLHLQDNILAYILPYLSNTMNIIIMRTFFKDISGELVEAAKIDGAREFRIFAQIILPLSKPVLATVAFMVMLDRWNDWMTSLLYISDEKLYSLQYMLQRTLREAEFIRNMVKDAPNGLDETYLEMARNLPTEGMRYALCVVAAGPMLVVFPFFQKYFVKGLTVGAVKG